jgi:transposase
VVRQVEEEVFRTLLARGIPPKYLLFDTTNFYTYHREGRFSKKGHSKERRADKNLTGLGLVTLGAIPVLSEVYAGNEADPQVFARVFEALLVRLERLEVNTEAMALVFDRGVNSTENFDEVLGAMHVIAALNRQDARALLATPRSEFHEVSMDGEGRPILGFPTQWAGFGRTWRVLVIHRVATAKHQQARWERTKAKVLAQVEQWRASLARGAPGRSQKALLRKLVELIPKDYHGVFDYGIEKRDGKYWPRCAVPEEAEARLRASFGTTTLITDLPASELSDAEFVRGYVARWEIEEDFKWLKDRFILSVKPVWVWNDAAVAGHVFLCVMGLMLLRYLQWEVRDLGLSMKELLEALEGIRIGVVRTSEGKPQMVLEQMTKLQGQVAERLHLASLVPR